MDLNSHALVLVVIFIGVGQCNLAPVSYWRRVRVALVVLEESFKPNHQHTNDFVYMLLGDFPGAAA